MKSKKITKETIESLGIRETNIPAFGIGDVVEVVQWVQEGDNKRKQIFTGNVIAKRNQGASSTFTVRKIAADGIAVERIYPVNSPIIDSVTVKTEAKVRRAKLYYLRDRIGKKAAVKEKIVKKTQVTKKKKTASETAA